AGATHRPRLSRHARRAVALLAAAARRTDRESREARGLRLLHDVDDDAVLHALVGLEHDLGELVARERGAKQRIYFRRSHHLAADEHLAAHWNHEHERRLRRIDLLSLALRQRDLDARLLLDLGDLLLLLDDLLLLLALLDLHGKRAHHEDDHHHQ